VDVLLTKYTRNSNILDIKLSEKIIFFSYYCSFPILYLFLLPSLFFGEESARTAYRSTSGEYNGRGRTAENCGEEGATEVTTRHGGKSDQFPTVSSYFKPCFYNWKGGAKGLSTRNGAVYQFKE